MYNKDSEKRKNNLTKTSSAEFEMEKYFLPNARIAKRESNLFIHSIRHKE